MATCLISHHLNAQTQAHFFGARTATYDRPIQVSHGVYKGYYVNSQLRERGTIILSIKNRTFSLKLLDGTKITYNISKTETENGSHLYYGRISNGAEALLIVSSDCHITMKFERFSDEEYGIHNYWRRIYDFNSQGCLN